MNKYVCRKQQNAEHRRLAKEEIGIRKAETLIKAFPSKLTDPQTMPNLVQLLKWHRVKLNQCPSFHKSLALINKAIANDPRSFTDLLTTVRSSGCRYQTEWFKKALAVCLMTK